MTRSQTPGVEVPVLVRVDTTYTPLKALPWFFISTRSPAASAMPSMLVGRPMPEYWPLVVLMVMGDAVDPVTAALVATLTAVSGMTVESPTSTGVVALPSAPGAPLGALAAT